MHHDFFLHSPIIDFLSSKKLISKEELGTSKLTVLSKTNMVDFAIDIHKELKREVPASMSVKREQVVANMNALKEEAAPILAIVQDAGRVAELSAERCYNQAYLQQQHNISPQTLDVLHRYAKCLFECGEYRLAADLLLHFRLLTCAPPVVSPDATTQRHPRRLPPRRPPRRPPPSSMRRQAARWP